MTDAIDTERLTLRRHRREDFPELAAMWADPEVTKHIGGKPLSEEDVWAKLLKTAGHWALLGFGYWVIRERGTNAFVGEAGLGDFKRELVPSFAGAPEIGWAVVPAQQGKGYALEAVRAVLAWEGAALASKRTVCLIDPPNLRSIRLAEKLGDREYARTTYKGGATILFERTK